MQSIVEFNKTDRLSFGSIPVSQSIEIRLSRGTQKYRLGALLIQKGVLTQSQLNTALTYQNTNQIRLGEALVALNYVTTARLKRVLMKQSWLKIIATVGAFVFAPLVSTSCFATNNQKVNTIKVASLEKPHSSYINNLQASFTPRSIDQQAKEYYFSSHETRANGNNVFFVVGRKLSQTTGLSINLFSQSGQMPVLTEWQSKNMTLDQKQSQENHFLHFDPQISIFKFSVQPSRFSFNKRKRFDMNHYTNTIPAVIMLTLKGRSIYESAGNQTRVWSLNRAKKGVQRKAQLMLSITKQF